MNARALLIGCLLLHASGSACAQSPKADPPAGENHVPRAAVLVIDDLRKAYRGKRDLELGPIPTDESPEEFRSCIPLLKEEKIDIVILRFECRAMYTEDVKPLSDIIHDELQKDFRVVGWIDTAQGNAGMLAFSIEELYFSARGEMGSAICAPGDDPAKKDEPLTLAPLMAERGKHDAKILRAMQVPADQAMCDLLKIPGPTGALSARIDDATGKIEFFQDVTGGPLVLNPRKEVTTLTLDSPTAEKLRLSRGTAHTIDELAALMQLQRVQWVGKSLRTDQWLLCKAEEKRWNARIEAADDHRRIQTLFERLQGMSPFEMRHLLGPERNAVMSIRSQELAEMKAIAERRPRALRALFPVKSEFDEWIKKTEDALKDAEAAAVDAAREPQDSQP